MRVCREQTASLVVPPGNKDRASVTIPLLLNSAIIVKMLKIIVKMVNREFLFCIKKIYVLSIVVYVFWESNKIYKQAPFKL